VVLGLECLALAPKPARPPPEGAFLKHKLGSGVNCPVMSFSRTTESLRQFNEALVEGKVVADRVLPALVRTSEERETLLQEGVNFAEGEPLGWRTLDGHDNEGDVGIWWFLLTPYAGVALLGDSRRH